MCVSTSRLIYVNTQQGCALVEQLRVYSTWIPQITTSPHGIAWAFPPLVLYCVWLFLQSSSTAHYHSLLLELTFCRNTLEPVKQHREPKRLKKKKRPFFKESLETRSFACVDASCPVVLQVQCSVCSFWICSLFAIHLKCIMSLRSVDWAQSTN